MPHGGIASLYYASARTRRLYRYDISSELFPTLFLMNMQLQQQNIILRLPLTSHLRSD